MVVSGRGFALEGLRILWKFSERILSNFVRIDFPPDKNCETIGNRPAAYPSGKVRMTRNHLDEPATSQAEDAFNRWPFSKRLADTIAEFDATDGAPVIGIYGKWGSGKTSVLNFLNVVLKDQYADKVILHPFNPWLFKDPETLLQRFFSELFKAMEQSSKTFGERMGGVLRDYSGLFGLVPGFGAGSKVAEQAGQALMKNVEQVRDEVRAMMKTAEKKVVVLIDDLDRLDRDEVLQLLKVVRLTANFPNVIYLLAFDDEMVGRAISQKYATGGDAGRQFLEKIVQYPFTLPAVTQTRLLDFVDGQAKAACDHAEILLSEAEWQEFRRLASSSLARRLTTPRQAIRYGNALRFALPMMKGEVNVLNQMAVEGLRILYPEIYVVVRDNKGVFADQTDPEVNRALDGSPFEQKDIIGNGQSLEERVAQATAEMQSDEATGAKALVHYLFERPTVEQGVGQPRYFDRYFSYGIANDEIGDREVLALFDPGAGHLRKLHSRNPNELLELMLIRLRGLDMKTSASLVSMFVFESATFDLSKTGDEDNLAYVIARYVLHAAEIQVEVEKRLVVEGDARELVLLVARDVEPLTLALRFREDCFAQSRSARTTLRTGATVTIRRFATRITSFSDQLSQNV